MYILKKEYYEKLKIIHENNYKNLKKLINENLSLIESFKNSTSKKEKQKFIDEQFEILLKIERTEATTNLSRDLLMIIQLPENEQIRH